MTGEHNISALEAEIKKLKEEIQQLKEAKKYGLVWEETEERLDNENIIPLVKENKDLRIMNNPENDTHYLIEGDNYHSLLALQKTHLGKIDVIYIDPPYGTGKEFVYNDKIVDKKDNFKHSKWLSFMSKRLKLAKNLLSEKGIIFISIDDNKQAHLKLLMDDIFGEQHFLTQLVWLYSKNKVVEGELLTTGANTCVIKKSKEYVLCYAKDNSLADIGRKQTKNDEIIKSRITKRGNKTSTILLKKGMLCDLAEGEFEGVVGGSSEPIRIEGKMTIRDYRLVRDVAITAECANVNIVTQLLQGNHPIDSKGQKYLSIRISNTGVPYTCKEKNGELYSDVISGYGGTALGSQEIMKLFGEMIFDYPKPKEVVKHLLRMVANKDATVLDFFAGSGTTGHAVMELNKEDNGNRKFILCTNNEVSKKTVQKYFMEQGLLTKNTKTAFAKFVKENKPLLDEFRSSDLYQKLGIARSVTYERLKRVIEGYVTPNGIITEGLSNNNLIYLQTTELIENPSTNKGKEVSLVTETLDLAKLKYQSNPNRKVLPIHDLAKLPCIEYTHDMTEYVLLTDKTKEKEATYTKGYIENYYGAKGIDVSAICVTEFLG